MYAYLICYELHKPHTEYQQLWDALKSLKTHCHLMKSAWVILTVETAPQLVDRLREYIHKDDAIFATRISDFAAELSTAKTAWLVKTLDPSGLETTEW